MRSFQVTVSVFMVLFLSAFGNAVAQGEDTQSSRTPKLAIGTFQYKGKMHLADGTGAFVDMLTTALVKTRRFKLVERDRVDEALEEMGLGEAGVVDPQNCQKLGTLVKSDLILFGSITQASLEDKIVNTRSIQTAKQELRMTVDIRIIDAKTGDIKTAETLECRRTTAKDVVVKGKRIATSDSASGIVGDVMRDLANDVTAKLVSSVFPITIASVRENDDGKVQSVKLDYGTPVIKEGELYDVCDDEGFKIGQIRATDVQGRFSFAETVKGGGSIESGMVCRKAKIQKTKPEAEPREILW